jgi:hypothetical protein
MPAHGQDTLVGLFRDDVTLAARVAGLLGAAVPEFDRVRIIDGDRTHRFDVDLVCILEDSTELPRFAVLVDVQRERDDRKHQTWPLDCSVCFVRYNCPAVLLVIAPDPEIADWCAQPIDLPMSPFRPLVPRGEQIPAAIDVEAVVHDTPLAVLSAAFHATGDLQDRIVRAAADGIRTLDATDPHTARRYADNVLAVLPKDARETLEAMITLPGGRAG